MSDFDLSKLYSSKELYPREIEACGETFTVHVKRLPAVKLRQFQQDVISEDREVRARAGFDALVQSIRTEDDKPFAKAANYEQFDKDAIEAFMKAFTSVNGTKAEELGNG